MSFFSSTGLYSFYSSTTGCWSSDGLCSRIWLTTLTYSKSTLEEIASCSSTTWVSMWTSTTMGVRVYSFDSSEWTSSTKWVRVSSFNSSERFAGSSYLALASSTCCSILATATSGERVCSLTSSAGGFSSTSYPTLACSTIESLFGSG